MTWNRLLWAAAVFAFLVSTAGAWLWIQLSTPYRGYTGSERFVLIPRGSSVARIGEILEEHGVVCSARLFTGSVRFHPASPTLKAGEYRFDKPLSLLEVLDILSSGRVYHHRVTILEGLSLEEIASLLDTLPWATRERIEQALRDPEPIIDLDPQAPDLEGYLFPETYHLTRDTTEEGVVAHLVRQFRRHWTPERQERARQINLTLREVVTLASLIEKETARPEERPLVSAVFHNRLARNIPLACDPTVIYAVKQVKTFRGVIYRSDLQLDSPYNTYLYPGLPPGPIANPGLASLDAALYPADVDYLFFVSRNDGTHVFSTDYRDHQRFVNRYQR